MFRRGNRSSTSRLPAAPRRRASCGLSSSRRTAAEIAEAFADGMTSPVVSCSSMCVTGPTSVAMTGMPRLMASSIVTPMPGRSAGRQNRSIAESDSAKSNRLETNVTRSETPSRRARSRSARSSGPLPAMRNSGSGSSGRPSSVRWSTPLRSCSSRSTRWAAAMKCSIP